MGKSQLERAVGIELNWGLLLWLRNRHGAGLLWRSRASCWKCFQGASLDVAKSGRWKLWRDLLNVQAENGGGADKKGTF